MGVHIGAQRHANYSDQGFKYLQRIYHEIDSQLIFLSFEAANGRIFVVMQKQY